jgi:hypothetical protein
MVSLDSILDFFSEVSDQTLNWPSSSITQSTDGMSFDLPSYFLEI